MPPTKPNHDQPTHRPNSPKPQPEGVAPAKSAPPKQLSIPSVAAGDPNSFELLRVWVAQQSQQVTLRPGIWQDPSAWGVMLADLARSIVKVHEENDEDLDAGAFLAAVLEGFDTEIESVLDEFGEGDEDDEQEAINN